MFGATDEAGVDAECGGGVRIRPDLFEPVHMTAAGSQPRPSRNQRTMGWLSLIQPRDQPRIEWTSIVAFQQVAGPRWQVLGKG